MPPREHSALCIAYLASHAQRYLRIAESVSLTPATREIVLARAELALLHIDRFSRPADQMLPLADPELDLAPYEASDTADTIPAPAPHMSNGFDFSV